MKFRIQQGACEINRIPYNNTAIKEKLYGFCDMRMKKTYQDIIKILDVNGVYDRNYIEKEIRVIRDNFITDIDTIKFTEILNQ